VLPRKIPVSLAFIKLQTTSLIKRPLRNAAAPHFSAEPAMFWRALTKKILSHYFYN